MALYGLVWYTMVGYKLDLVRNDLTLYYVAVEWHAMVWYARYVHTSLAKW